MFDYNIIKEQMFRTNVRGGKMIIGKYKIVNKGKFISFIALILIAIIITIFIFTNNNKVYSSIYEEKYLEIMVEQGDTLWNIAINNMPIKYDVRKMVFEIIKFNEMKNANIYPGDLIKIPIKHNPK